MQKLPLATQGCLTSGAQRREPGPHMYMCTVVREREENAGDEVAPFVATCHCVVPAYMHLPTTTVCTTVPLLLFIGMC